MRWRYVKIVLRSVVDTAEAEEILALSDPLALVFDLWLSKAEFSSLGLSGIGSNATGCVCATSKRKFLYVRQQKNIEQLVVSLLILCVPFF